MKPTIVWNAAGLSETLTGIERLAAAYTHQMAAEEPDICQVFVAERRYRWLDSLASGVKVVFVPHLPATVLMPRVILGYRHSAWHSWANPVAPRSDLRRRYSVTIHDWTPYERSEMKAHHRAFWKAAIRWNLHTASAVHMTTEQVRDAVPSKLARELRRKRLLVGGDVPTLPLAGGAERGSDGSIARPYVLTVGTLIPRKRLRETVALWETAVRAGAPRLIVVGKGTEELGNGFGYRALGYVSDGRLATLIHEAEALLSLSDREGLNLPVREALRSGTPVVGTPGALGTLKSVGGVFSVDVRDWSDHVVVRESVLSALNDISDSRMSGKRVGEGLTDGDVLVSFLRRRAHGLLEQS